MGTYDIGREFEKEAFIYLKKRFKNVTWLSESHQSTFDFRCDDESGSVLYGDAKVSSSTDKPRLSYSQRDADFVIAKIRGSLNFIPKEDFKERVLIQQTLLVSIYLDKDFLLELKKLAKEDGRSLNNFILHTLSKHLGVKM